MRAGLAMVVGAALVAGQGGARAEPGAVDLGPLREQLRVLTDGKGHYLALAVFTGSGLDEPLFYGDGKRMVKQRLLGGGSEGTVAFSRSFWEPRARVPAEATVWLRDGAYQLQCQDRVTPLRALAPDEAKALVAAAAFVEPSWSRRAYALARDDAGTYYYVDRLRDERKAGFRLYAGPRGRLRPLRMVNVVSDSAGDIFATRNGRLRLVLGDNEATWVRGRDKRPLTLLPIEDNHVLVYTDLGVYLGERLGTPCDDL